MKTLLVLAAGAALCPDFEAMEEGVLRFIGRRLEPNAGVTWDPRRKTDVQTHGWVPVAEPTRVPFRREYLDELKAGALVPADAETARLCGMPLAA